MQHFKIITKQTFQRAEAENFALNFMFFMKTQRICTLVPLHIFSSTFINDFDIFLPCFGFTHVNNFFNHNSLFALRLLLLIAETNETQHKKGKKRPVVKIYSHSRHSRHKLLLFFSDYFIVLLKIDKLRYTPHG